MATETWTIDTTHSSIQFTVRHMVFAKVRGRFARWGGEVRIDAADPARSVAEARVDAASIDTGVPDRDAHVRSADFLDVERHPEIVFKSRWIEQIDATRFRLTGALTIRDVTRDVTLDAERTGTGVDPWGHERAGFSARVSFDRRDFGVTFNKALDTGGVLVGDRIDVEIEIEAVKQVAEKAA